MTIYHRLILLLTVLVASSSATAQNNSCSGALILCAGSSLTGTTLGATAGAGDVLHCGDGVVNNNVWFKFIAISNGTVTLTVSNIGNAAGLDMEIFTGACGSLVTTSACTTGTPATGGQMSLTIATTAGTTYYVMVDGVNGNAESFDIIANSTTNSIVGRPSSNFNTNPSYGCAPLNVQLDNTTALLGGSNITYGWSFDNGANIPASGNDSNTVFTTPGVHTVALRVCNTECGCKNISQEVTVQEMYPSISFVPPLACVGAPIDFTGSVIVLPDPPYTDPMVTDWTWNFDDPNSGTANTAHGQYVTHVFSGPQTLFNVTLTVDGVCGPETVTQMIDLNPKPDVVATSDVTICEGATATIGSFVSGGSPGYFYDWTGNGSITCSTCPTTDVNGLTAGGPYEYIITATDNLGCTNSDTTHVIVNPQPVVTTVPILRACVGSQINLTSTITVGNGPFTYHWSPGIGLSDSTSANPLLDVVGNASYCVTVTDAAGCSSTPSCTSISLYAPPSVTPTNNSICASDPAPQTDFVVTGAGIGSTYAWGTSANYSLITVANSDSSRISVNFPPGIAANYSFTVIVHNATTGCNDTVDVPFTIFSGLNVTISGPLNICEGTTATLVANGASTYSWTSNPPYPFVDSTNAIQLVTPAATTTFTLTGITGSCTLTLTRTITLTPAPDVTVAPIAPFCGCSNIQLSASSSISNANFQWFGSGSISNPNFSTTGAYACPNDSFTVRVTNPVNNCRKDSTLIAPSRALPTAIASVFPSIICPGIPTSIDLNGIGSASTAGTIYHWSCSNPGVTIADTTDLTTTATVSNTTIFYLTVTDVFGCDSTVSDTVVVQPLPILSTANPFLCITSPGLTSTLSVTGADPSSSIAWTTIPSCVTPAATSSQTETFDFTSCGVGTYTFNVTVDDPVSGCTSNISQQINVVNGVVLTTTDDTSMCEGSTIQLIASGANTFLWNNGINNDTLTVSGLSASGSPYNFTVFGSTGNCTASSTIVVTVLQAPTTGPIIGAISACANSSNQTYVVTPVNGDYRWSIVGGTIQSGQGTNSIIVDWGNATVGTISVIDSNGTGCPGTLQTLQVAINQGPSVAPLITGPAALCFNQQAIYDITPTPGSIYSWTVTGGNIIGSNIGSSVNVQWPTSGSGIVSVVETYSNGCSGPAGTYNVSINNNPIAPTINGSLQICQGSSLLYTTTANPGSFYTWQPNGGLISNSNFYGDSVTITWPNAGNFSISLTETNISGCTSAATTELVTVGSQPFVNVLDDSTSGCQNIDLSLLTTVPFGNINWTTSGSGTFSDPTAPSPTYNTGLTDTGNVILTVIASAGGCPSDTGQVVVTVYSTPTIQLTNSLASLCQGLSSTLTANAAGTNTYLWTPGGATTSSIIVTPTVSTTYTVQVTNGGGCSSNDTTHIEVLPAGVANAGDDIISCLGTTIPLNGTQLNSSGVIWSTDGDGLFIPSNTDYNPVYIPGTNDTTNRTNTIYLTTTGACLDAQDTMTITYSNSPTAYAGPDTILSSGFTSGISIQLQPQVTNVTGIVWSSTGTGLFTPSDTTLYAYYEPSANDFTLPSVVITMTTVGGCQTLSDDFVIEFTPLVIPNVFTPYPASPGKNDYFVIPNLPTNSELKIWDRWGILVFETLNYQNNWDAANLHSETYYYVLNARSREFHGWVQVLREEK